MMCMSLSQKGTVSVKAHAQQRRAMSAALHAGRARFGVCGSKSFICGSDRMQMMKRAQVCRAVSRTSAAATKAEISYIMIKPDGTFCLAYGDWSAVCVC